MYKSKSTLNKSTVFLIAFVISCFATFYAISISNLYLTLFLITVKYAFLGFYHVSLVKKYSIYIITILTLFFISSVFFTFSPVNTYGIIFIIFCRVLLIKFPLTGIKIKNIDWKVFITVFLIFILVVFMILSLYYNNSSFFYLSLIATLSLIILLSLAFLNLINSIKKGNLEFFGAISLFAVSDTISGTQRLMEISPTFVVIASVLYNLAYFLIVKSDIKRIKSIT